mgnify:CR=1 FL=1
MMLISHSVQCGTEILMCLWLSELSNPFMHTRELLKELGLKDTTFAVANDVSLVAISIWERERERERERVIDFIIILGSPIWLTGLIDWLLMFMETKYNLWDRAHHEVQTLGLPNWWWFFMYAGNFCSSIWFWPVMPRTLRSVFDCVCWQPNTCKGMYGSKLYYFLTMSELLIYFSSK